MERFIIEVNIREDLAERFRRMFDNENDDRNIALLMEKAIGDSIADEQHVEHEIHARVDGDDHGEGVVEVRRFGTRDDGFDG